MPLGMFHECFLSRLSLSGAAFELTRVLLWKRLIFIHLLLVTHLTSTFGELKDTRDFNTHDYGNLELYKNALDV